MIHNIDQKENPTGTKHLSLLPGSAYRMICVLEACTQRPTLVVTQTQKWKERRVLRSRPSLIYSSCPYIFWYTDTGSWWFFFSYCPLFFFSIFPSRFELKRYYGGGKYRRKALTTSRPSGLRHSCVVHIVFNNVVNNSMCKILFHILIVFWHMLTTKKLVWCY